VAENSAKNWINVGTKSLLSLIKARAVVIHNDITTQLTFPIIKRQIGDPGP
jgi:hypothetical protein